MYFLGWNSYVYSVSVNAAKYTELGHIGPRYNTIVDKILEMHFL